MESKVPRCDGVGVGYDVSLVRDECLDVPVLTEIVLGMVKLITVDSEWRKDIGHGRP